MNPQKKVLIIEDDLNYGDLLCRWLEVDGNFQTVLLADALQGLEVATTETWDLIISDINLPHTNGFEFVQEYKNVKPETPILLMTATESVEYAIKAIQIKVDDFLIKPFKRSQFVEKAKELILKKEIEKRKTGKTILTIGAHPDDIEIGCGGTLLQHVSNGDHINILTLTNGAVGGEIALRKEESETAARMLNAKLFWGNLQDTKISDGTETIKIIQNVINITNPDVIYTHTKNDNHQDHRNTHFATIVAGRKVENVFCYLTPSSTIDFRPTLFSEIDEFVSKKIEIIKCFQTQTEKCAYLSEEMIASTSVFWGRFANYKKVEPFEIVKQKVSS